MDKLTIKEKMEITIQTGLQLIPTIGSALSTAYFGTKQEKRFKRIESFYQELSEEIKNTIQSLPPINIHNQDDIIKLIEELNDKVEREHSEIKRSYFKKYFFHTLSNQVTDNFDEKLFFLHTLSGMTLLECDILILLHQNKKAILVKEINGQNLDIYAIVGAVGRLKTFGFLITKNTSFINNGTRDLTLDESIELSNFGVKFVNYCLLSF